MENFGQLKNNSAQRPGIVQELMTAVVALVLVYIVLTFTQVLYNYYNRLSMNRTDLLPNTYNTDNKSLTVPQNPNVRGSKSVNLSDNERTGIEFTYTFYLFVHPSTFRTEKGLLHIFHKGFPGQFPLLGPGVYMRSDTNTLRIYMNTYKTWNNYVEVENIPISKWVYVSIVCKSNALEIFVNGNLSKRLGFEGFQPYQNYQDIVCFSPRKITLKKSTIPSVDEDGFEVYGVMKGMLSKLAYFSYALCYSEINSLMNEGPSNKMDQSEISGLTPPYLDDTWWSKSY